MHQKIKAFFYHINKRKIYSFPLITTALLFFPKITFAWTPWDYLIGAINILPSKIVLLLAQAVILITSFIAATASMLLTWVLSPGFTNFSYTNNPIIEIGLNVTQSFVNMALVLILVFIAFATILRLKEYQTQKLLITLVVVALLVNFAPVICGLIIDPCNILMHYFTDNVTGLKTVMNISSGYSERMQAGIGEETLTKQIEVLTESLILIIFNSLLAFITLMYSLIFAARYAVIWVLVILSPLAFVSYILPATKKIWEQWWTQFINWSIVGISTGFFLYLSEQVIEKANDISIGAPTSETVGAASVPLQYMVPLIFMFLGLMFALQSPAMGVNVLKSISKKTGKKVGNWALKGGKKTVKGVYKGTLRGIDQGIRGAVRGSKENKGAGFGKRAWGGVKESGKGLGRGLVGLEDSGTASWGRRMKDKVKDWTKEKLGIHESGKDELGKGEGIEEAEKRMAALHRSKPEAMKKIVKDKPLNKKGGIDQKAALNVLAKNKKLQQDDIEKIIDMINAGEKGLDIKAIITARPDLTPNLTGGKATIEQQVQKQSPEKLIENTQPEAFKKLQVIRHLNKKQLDYIATSEKVSNEVRNNMLDTVIRNRNYFNYEINRLLTLGTAEDIRKAEKLHNLEMAVLNPNFIN